MKHSQCNRQCSGLKYFLIKILTIVMVWWSENEVIHYQFLKTNESFNIDKHCSNLPEITPTTN